MTIRLLRLFRKQGGVCEILSGALSLPNPPRAHDTVKPYQHESVTSVKSHIFIELGETVGLDLDRYDAPEATIGFVEAARDRDACPAKCPRNYRLANECLAGVMILVELEK